MSALTAYTILFLVVLVGGSAGGAGFGYVVARKMDAVLAEYIDRLNERIDSEADA